MKLKRNSSIEKGAAKAKSPAFTLSGTGFPIPRELVARTEILTRNKRRLPNGLDEAVATLQREARGLMSDARGVDAAWGAQGVLQQARIKAAMAVLITFGVTKWPLEPMEEAAARLLAGEPA